MSDWRDAVRPLLAKLGAVRDFSTADFGRHQLEGALSVLVPGGGTMVEEGPISALKSVRAKLPAGTVALLGTTRWLGKGQESLDGKVELFVCAGKDAFDAVTHARTDAINYGHETAAVVKRLRELHATYGLDVFHAETDTVEAFITRTDVDFAKMAAEIYEFCPDVVDQGVGSVEDLEAALESDRRLYLWWD